MTSRYFIAPDGADEPCLWLPDLPHSPALVLRKAELPGPSRARVDRTTRRTRHMRTTTERHGSKAPEGYHWVATAVGDNLHWRLCAPGKKCRAGASRTSKACGRPAVAELNRGHWWAYCEDHMYGRWIEDGLIWHWVLRAIEEDDE